MTGIFFFLFDEAGKEKGKKMDYAFDLRERKKAFFFFCRQKPHQMKHICINP